MYRKSLTALSKSGAVAEINPHRVHDFCRPAVANYAFSTMKKIALATIIAGLVATSSATASAVPLVVGGGLTPNARALAQYITATYPGVRSIGGVRPDSRPDHPSGRALDIMIGSDMGLGDAINADIQSQAGRFGVEYTMWRVASHFDHIHVTVG